MRKLSSVSIRGLFIVLAFTILVSAQQPFNKGEFEARRAELFEKISDGIAVIFAAEEQFYPIKFRQSPDFYYLTGIEEAGAVLVMVGPNKSTILFVPRRSPEQVRADGPGIWQVEKREEIYGLTRVQPIEEFLPSLQFLGLRAQKLYMLSGSQGNVQNSREELDFFESLEMTHSVVGGLSESKKTIAVMRQVLPHLTFQSLNPFLDDMRWIKSPYEIELMKKSCEIGADNRYIGHTVGIAVHDVDPDRSRPLVAGVVYNVEPLLELPDKKTHMRVEDTVLITPTGAVNMTAGVPAALDEIYALIRQKALSINP
jgi:Xaa-Pro aminopeptidase